MCRELTSAALGVDACPQVQHAPLTGAAAASLASRPYQGISQFVYDQYAYLNYPGNPMIMSTAPYQTGQVCSTVGEGQPGYGNVLGCVAYSDAVKIVPNMAETGTRPGTLAFVTSAAQQLQADQFVRQQQHQWIQRATLANQINSYPPHCGRVAANLSDAVGSYGC